MIFPEPAFRILTVFGENTGIRMFDGALPKTKGGQNLTIGME
jgi:hypothetical protein